MNKQYYQEAIYPMNKFTARSIAVAIVIGFFIIALISSTYIIDSGERGILLTWGKASSVSADGIHFKIPIVQKVVITSIRTEKAERETDASTQDMQSVRANIAVNYHFGEFDLVKMYSNFGFDITEKIIMPRIQEVSKAVIARYSAENILVNRDKLTQEIKVKLHDDLKQYNVVVENISMTNFEFSRAFDKAIEDKQIAEQNALKARNDLERVKIEAEQKLTQAKTEAEAIRIQTEAIRSNGGAEYIKLKYIEKWNGVMPSVMSDGTMPILNLGK